MKHRIDLTNHEFWGRLGDNEKFAITQALEAGRQWGYGNVMAWIATAWAEHLIRHEGFSVEDAEKVVSNRGPYRLRPPTSRKRGMKTK